MAIKPWVQQRFYGGMATDPKIGIRESFAYSQSYDFRKNPSQMSILPGPAREDAAIVKDLILNEVMTGDGAIYSFGDDGYFYKRTTTGVWSTEGKLSSGCAGIDYRKDTDAIYLTTDKTVSLYTPILGLGSPTLLPDYYNSSFSTYNNSDNTGFNVSAYQTSSSQTTTVQVATTPLNETQGNVRYFQSDIEPLNKTSVFIPNKGTGDWTLTLHDGLNNVLATATVVNANLNNNTWNDFTFTAAPNSQVRIYVAPNARTYHFHLTSTVADGTVSSSINNDLGSCDLMIWADRLIQTNNGLHPIQRFLQYETIGNANYVSVWEPLSDPPTNAEWQRHALVFPREYEVCGLATQNEFLVIALEQTTTTSSTPQQGLIAFWDGTSSKYNYYVYIPEGSPQAIHTYKNITYYYAGGAWWAITSVYTQPVKIRTMPDSDTEFSSVGTVETVGASGHPLTATLTDNFNGSSSLPDPSKWDGFGNYTQSNGNLLLKTDTTASYQGIDSHVTNYDLTDSIVQVRLANAGNQALTSLEVYPVICTIDSNNQIGWYVNQNQIKAYKLVAGVFTAIATATYVAATFQYLRMRELSGTVYWDYSADGVTWFNLASAAPGIAITSLILEVIAGTFNNEGVTTTIQVDDFNIISGVSPITVYPYAATIRRGIHMLAWPSKTTDTTINCGVYSWGSVDKNYPESFGYSYLISTGTKNFTAQNNLQIGMVKSFGDLMHISWRDDGTTGIPTYGIDVVSNSSPPASYAKYQSLIIDSGYTAKQKIAQYIEAYFYLPTGTSIALGYSINRDDFVVDANVYTPANLWNDIPGYAKFGVSAGSAGRYYEFQAQVEMFCDSTATQPPVLRMLSIIYSDGSEEKLV